MGRRNAKPTADREVVDEYIHYANTSVGDERHQSRTKREDMDAEKEGKQRWRYRGGSRPL
jgi:hypothetical protein